MIDPGPWRTLGLILVGIGSTIAAVVFALWREEMELPIPVILLVTYLRVPFFAFATVCLVYRLLHPKPAPVIDDEGIREQCSAVEGRAHPLVEDRARLHVQADGLALGIEVRDEQALIARADL